MGEMGISWLLLLMSKPKVVMVIHIEKIYKRYMQYRMMIDHVHLEFACHSCKLFCEKTFSKLLKKLLPVTKCTHAKKHLIRKAYTSECLIVSQTHVGQSKSSASLDANISYH